MSNHAKRFIALCLTIVMIVGLLPATLFSVGAQEAEDGNIVFSVSSVSGQPGTIVEMEISVSGNAEVSGLLLYGIQYDTSALEFVAFQDYGELVTESTAGTSSVSGSVINLGFSPNTVPNGKICSAVFRIKDSAQDGNYAIRFTHAAASDNGTPVPSVFNEGTLTVFTWLPGDFDENGIVTLFISWVGSTFPIFPECTPWFITETRTLITTVQSICRMSFTLWAG